MKAIGIKMVDLVPMTAIAALNAGYRVTEAQSETNVNGYEVTYEGGYKSWTPESVANKAYLILSDYNGSTITQEDVDNFIEIVQVETWGRKTTVVQAVVKNTFEFIESSSCADPKNYNEEYGAKIAVDRIKDKIWAHLGFVLQWAKSGLYNNDCSPVKKQAN